MRRILVSCLVLAVLQPVLAAEVPLPLGTVQRGTLANNQLIADTKVGVAQHVGSLGCAELRDVDTYVTQMPVGEPGKKHWKELWIVSGCNKKFPVHISFNEDPTGATWSIQ